MQITKVNVNDIKVINRARSVYTNMESLKDSISANGLLHPIIINDEMELLAGGRRLQAHKELGIKDIACIIKCGLSYDDKLIIELIENQDRDDFTWAEACKLKKRIHDHYIKINPKWGYRETAKRLNVSLGGLSSDIEVAKAIKVFPQLAELATKAKARDAYKKMVSQAEAVTTVANLSEDEQAMIREMFGHTEQAPPTVSNKETPVQTHQSNAPLAQQAIVGTTTPEQTTTAPQRAVTATKDFDLAELPEYTYRICDYKEMLKAFPDNIIGFAELDPPYAINFDEVYGKTSNVKVLNKDWSVEKLKANMTILFKELYKKLMHNSWVLCWTAKEHFTLINYLASEAGFLTQSPGVWIKSSGTSNTPRSVMISQYEMFLLMRKGTPQFNIPSFSNVLQCNTVPHSKRGHQWEKPIELYNKFMVACGRPSTIFFSPFAGSGMSMISAALNKMTPAGCDINQKYFYRFLSVYKDHFPNNQKEIN